MRVISEVADAKAGADPCSCPTHLRVPELALETPGSGCTKVLADLLHTIGKEAHDERINAWRLQYAP